LEVVTKYCKYCGSEIYIDSEICLNCGRRVSEIEAKADNSVTLGLVALIVGMFIPLVAWIVGGIGLSVANRTNNSVGKKLNVAAIIIGTIVFLFAFAMLSQ
jgi:uncharacterized membrane protein YvbJ